MTFNIRVYDLSLAREFLKRGIALQGFDSYDGGGSCGYIIEFQRREDLEAFCRELTPTGRLCCWIEHDDGSCEESNP